MFPCIVQESISTCRFAQRVALIKNEALLNEELDPRLLAEKLRREVAQLKEELALATGEFGNNQNTEWEGKKHLNIPWLVERAHEHTNAYSVMRNLVKTVFKHIPSLTVRYEELQQDTAGTLAKVGRFLNIDNEFNATEFAGTKVHPEDLSEVIPPDDFDRLQQYLGDNEPCLLPMLLAKKPQVFGPCTPGK